MKKYTVSFAFTAEATIEVESREDIEEVLMHEFGFTEVIDVHVEDVYSEDEVFNYWGKRC